MGSETLDWNLLLANSMVTASAQSPCRDTHDAVGSSHRLPPVFCSVLAAHSSRCGMSPAHAKAKITRHRNPGVIAEREIDAALDEEYVGTSPIFHGCLPRPPLRNVEGGRDEQEFPLSEHHDDTWAGVRVWASSSRSNGQNHKS